MRQAYSNFLDETAKRPEMNPNIADKHLKLLAIGGMLVKRPLVIGDGFVLVGFKESEWNDKL